MLPQTHDRAHLVPPRPVLGKPIPPNRFARAWAQRQVTASRGQEGPLWTPALKRPSLQGKTFIHQVKGQIHHLMIPTHTRIVRADPQRRSQSNLKAVTSGGCLSCSEGREKKEQALHIGRAVTITL